MNCKGITKKDIPKPTSPAVPRIQYRRPKETKTGIGIKGNIATIQNRLYNSKSLDATEIIFSFYLLWIVENLVLNSFSYTSCNPVSFMRFPKISPWVFVYEEKRAIRKEPSISKKTIKFTYH